MNKFAVIVCLSILSAGVAFAAGQKTAPAQTKAEAPAPAETAKTQPEEPTTIVLKNKSSFQLDAGTRSPFWPIGFKPKGRIGGAGDADGEVPASAFVVSSITLDATNRFAIINGKTMKEGQQFGLQVGTQIYQVSVKRIEDGQVILGRHDEEIVVPLRRK